MDNDQVGDYAISMKRFQMQWSMVPHQVGAPGWTEDSERRWQSVTEAMMAFNTLLANPDVQRAELTLAVMTKDKGGSGGGARFRANHFVIASFNRQDPTMVSHALHQDFWEADREQCIGQRPTYYGPDGYGHKEDEK